VIRFAKRACLLFVIVLTLPNTANADPELEGVDFLIWHNQGEEIKNTLRDLAFTGVFGAMSLIAADISHRWCE